MNVPVVDNIAKLLVFGGIALLIYATEYIKPQYESIEKLQFLKDSVDRILKNKDDKAQASFEFKMTLFQLQNADLFDSTGKLKDKDVFSSTYLSRFDSFFNDDSSKSDYKFYFGGIDTLKQHSERFSLLINTARRNYAEQLDKFFLAAMIGALLLIVGLAYWISRETFEQHLLKRLNIDKPTFSERCQSCAKFFDSIVIPGSDSDGQRNFNFCNVCYQNGNFQDASLEALKERILSELVSKKVSKSIQKKVIATIPKLDRWKKNQFVRKDLKQK